MRILFTISLLVLGCFGAVACQSAPSPTPYPTYTAYPTYTPYPTTTPVQTESRLPSAEIEDLVWPTGSRDDVIPVEDAGDFINETVTVEGTIVRTHNSGGAVFLNFSPDYADGFTAVIFPDDWKKFPTPPEDLFYGKLVRVAGTIEEYQGKPEIVIKDPWQIEVALTLGQPVVTDCNCQQPPQAEATATALPTIEPAAVITSTPEPATASLPAATTASQPDVISWQEAAGYEGRSVTVEGKVVDTYNSGKVIFLNFDQAYRDSFKVVIFPDAWALFPAAPDDYYRGKSVQVTGQVKMYEGSPEIIVDHPDRIVIVE